jgi:hypothetical protein
MTDELPRETKVSVKQNTIFVKDAGIAADYISSTSIHLRDWRAGDAQIKGRAERSLVILVGIHALGTESRMEEETILVFKT